MEEAEAPTLNVMMEDYLANGSTQADHALMLKAWLRLGVEYLARTAGRGAARSTVDDLGEFVRTAKPVRPWNP